MARHYTPRGVLRHVPVELWREFFASQSFDIELDWDEIGDDIKPVYEAWSNLPAGQRDRCEQVFQQVHELGTQTGLRILMEEARLEGVDGPDPKLEYGPVATALWMRLHAPEAFQRATLFQHTESLSERYWHRIPGVQAKNKNFTPKTLVDLSNRISHYLREEQGRGYHCTIEHYPRGNTEHYLFCYPDDYTETEVGHDERGQLRRAAVRRTFEVIYHYDTATGELHVFAPLNKSAREDLTRLFTQTVLQVEFPEVNLGRPPYELDGLFDPNFPLPYDPQSGIRAVTLRRLRVSWNRKKRRLVFEKNSDGTIEDMRPFFARNLACGGIPPKQLAHYRSHLCHHLSPRQSPP